MACRDWEPADSGVSHETHERALTENTRLRNRLDAATRVACEIEKLLTEKQNAAMSNEARQWVAAHRVADAKREREEAERIRREEQEKSRKAKLEKDRKAALNKLTKEERRVLGLPDPA